MYFTTKRLFDIIISLAAVILLLPLLILISFAVLISSGSPVFYLQKRVGKDWKIFKIIKFRTMVNNADKIGPGISSLNDNRITFTGKILRKFKLDELPQFLNVLLGTMSLIGPRPELEKYVSHYRKDYSEILKIKPGITDYASIKFKNESALFVDAAKAESFYIKEILPQKISLYKKYISEMSIATDLKIFFETAKGIML
ncbi:MAG: sugar transferase [Ignavibacteriaceae bacterium]